VRRDARGDPASSLIVVDGSQPFTYHPAVPHEPTTQVAFRLADRMLARLDRHAKRLGKEHAGIKFTRADAVRDLLTRALDDVEQRKSAR